MHYSAEFIPANNPNIRFSGRWDMTDSLNPRHSWPGTYITAVFSGTSLGVRMDDNVNYYNIYIDGKLAMVFHGDKQGTADYPLAGKLADTLHTLRISKRNISFDKVFTFSGLILDDGKKLFAPEEKPVRKIEFIGDSYTAAEGNEAALQEIPWEEKFPVTNIDLGFAPVIARHYNAEYHTTCRSGIGMVCDWTGNFSVSLPKFFDRTLMETPERKWDFNRWHPDVVVIALGLNDYSGLKDKDGSVSKENSEKFRHEYREFLKIIRKVYPGVQIVVVAAYTDWIRENVIQIAYEEKKDGKADIHYSQFDYFDGGYVANGHPTVETHAKMAEQIIKTIDMCNLFTDTAHPSYGK
ncbi:MAG: SGNH/GDSL hydrolase family protein [Syntrophothermus sp.]